MLISTKIKIKVYAKTFKHLRNKGYDFNGVGDEIEIITMDLLDGSNHLVDVKCDYCGNESKIRWVDYVNNVKRNNDYKCSKCKLKRISIKKYGVENISQSNIIKERKKKTCLNNFGVEHPLQSTEIKNKSKDTLYKKYGVENISQVDDIKIKKEITTLKNYGVKNPSYSNEIKKKISENYKKSCMEKYGVPSTLLIPGNRDGYYRIRRYKDTNLFVQSKYEVDFLDFCFNNDIIVENGKIFNYLIENIEHKYFSDFYISSLDLIVEIKSTWTYEHYLDKNLIKKNSVIKAGHDFLFIIDKDYNEFKEKINFGD